ncbi:MAG: WbqC family protein, partial [Fusobacterium sp.]
IGGQELYSFEEFKNNGIELKFLKTEEIIYKQFTNEFIPNLSILDVMMFNSKEKVKEFLENYTLIKQEEK